MGKGSAALLVSRSGHDTLRCLHGVLQVIYATVFRNEPASVSAGGEGIDHFCQAQVGCLELSDKMSVDGFSCGLQYFLHMREQRRVGGDASQ